MLTAMAFNVIHQSKLLRMHFWKPTHYSTMAANSSDISEAKNKLRSEIKAKLKAMEEVDKIRQSYIITRRLITHPDFQSAERIAIYVNMKNEVCTYDILKEAFKTKKQVFIPMVIGDDMKMVKLDSMNELEIMPKTKWGIIQPVESDHREDCLDSGGVPYIVVPGLGFTSTGLRLGRGKGYYDKFLAKNNELRKSSCITVGLGFNEQIVKDLPTNKNDFRLTWVIYPEMCALFSKYNEMPSEFTPPPEPFTI